MALGALAELSEGDARQALGTARRGHRRGRPTARRTPSRRWTSTDLDQLIQHRAVRYDKAGEEHFNLISALHKSLRNSDVQAGVYWLTRMLEGGEDPLPRPAPGAIRQRGRAAWPIPQALPQALAARDAVQFHRPAGGRAGPGPGRGLPGARAQEQRALHRLQGGAARGANRRTTPRRPYTCAMPRRAP